MAASPSTALLGLPPLRPSPSKQPSFGRTASSHNVHHPTASSSSSMMPGGSSTGTSSSHHTATQRRARSSSIVSVQEVPETYDDQLDQGALTNVNAEWVNSKGAQFYHLEPVESGDPASVVWFPMNAGALSADSLSSAPLADRRLAHPRRLDRTRHRPPRDDPRHVARPHMVHRQPRLPLCPSHLSPLPSPRCALSPAR